MTSPIFQAIRRGHREAVRQMVASDPGIVGTTDDDGLSPLMVALYFHQAEIAEDLLERTPELTIFEAAAAGRADRVAELLKKEPALVNASSPDGFSPLGLAAFFHRTAVVTVLLNAGSEVNAASRNSFRVQPLHSAVANQGDHQIVSLLLAAGADVNAKQRHGFTPLQAAADAGDLALVQLLLDAGADVGATQDGGKTALDLARSRGHAPVVERLERAARAATPPRSPR